LLSAGYGFAADTEAGTAGRPTAVLTDGACLAIWHNSAADELARFHVGGRGLTPAAAKGIVTNFQQADVDNDGNISQAEFVEACKLGLVTGPVLGLHSGS
jgi:hypothetical protein